MTVAYFASSRAIRGTGDLTVVANGGGANPLSVLFVNTDKNATVTAPSGWTEAPSSPQVTSSTTDNGSQLAVFWIRDSSPSVTVADPSTTADGAFARILSFSGVEPDGDPFDATAGATSSQTSTSTSTNQFLLDSSGDYNAWTHTANVTGSGGAITHNTTATDADGSGTNGQIQHRITGRTVSCTNTSSIGITPTSYGVPSGSKIVGYTIVYAWRCSEYTTGASSTVRLSAPGGATNTFTATGNYADSTYTPSTFTVSTAALDPASTFTLTFTSALNTGNSSTAAVAVLLDYVRVTFDYVSTTLTFPSLTTANPNTLVIMAASNAYDATAQDSYDITTFANANLTSVADRGTSSSTGTLTASGKTAVGTGFSATAQNIGASTATAGRPHVPVAFWTGAILGTDSLPYSHRGWGIPMNSERQP